jgi:misacylated tRNA(Ala) deacylase
VTTLLFRDDAYLRQASATVVAVRENVVELDRTIFYPLGGGQPGDTGMMSGLRVIDTRKGADEDSVLHCLEPGAAMPAVGSQVELEIDWARRHRHMRFHTVLHLLGAFVKAPYTGCRIAEDKSHLDFDTEMEKLVKEEIEAGLNGLISTGQAMRAEWVAYEQLESNPDLVKTLSVMPPRGADGRVRMMAIEGLDVQPCGGTHVLNTSEIGKIAVSRIRNEGKRNKRVTLVFAD